MRCDGPRALPRADLWLPFQGDRELYINAQTRGAAVRPQLSSASALRSRVGLVWLPAASGPVSTRSSPLGGHYFPDSQ